MNIPKITIKRCVFNLSFLNQNIVGIRKSSENSTCVSKPSSGKNTT